MFIKIIKISNKSTMGGYSSKPIKYNITYDENGIMIVYTSDRVIKNKVEILRVFDTRRNPDNNF